MHRHFGIPEIPLLVHWTLKAVQRWLALPGDFASSAVAALHVFNLSNATISTQLDDTGRQARVENSGFAGYPMAGRSFVAIIVGEF